MAFIHSLSPVLLKLGPLEIRWYGVMYVLGFLVTLWYLRKLSREKRLKLSFDEIDNLMTWLVVALIVGARLFEVFVWEPGYFLQHPWEIPMVWKGGLSFHGSLLFMILTALWWCRRKNIRVLDLADVIIIPLSLAQAFGRFGNFMNSELFGPATMLPWGINFLNETDSVGGLVFRHPTMLYELFYNVIIFCILLWLARKHRHTGAVFGSWLVLYAIFRSLTEFLRLGDYYVGPLTTGQWLNVPMFLIGCYLLMRKNKD